MKPSIKISLRWQDLNSALFKNTKGTCRLMMKQTHPCQWLSRKNSKMICCRWSSLTTAGNWPTSLNSTTAHKVIKRQSSTILWMWNPKHSKLDITRRQVISHILTCKRVMSNSIATLHMPTWGNHHPCPHSKQTQAKSHCMSARDQFMQLVNNRWNPIGEDRKRTIFISNSLSLAGQGPSTFEDELYILTYISYLLTS